MEQIVELKGNVAFPITLDPSVWIFDDRKKKLDDFFSAQQSDENELESYTKAISKQWDKEVTEGNEAPKQSTKTKKYLKEELLSETYGISLQYFLKNSEPDSTASKLAIHAENKIYTFSLENAYSFVLCFSENGKPLKEDGPLHVYYGSTPDQKITSVRMFQII